MEYVRTITPKKYFYLKLPNAYITMLKTTVVSKTAIGLLNTSNNKIITVLTL